MKIQDTVNIYSKDKIKESLQIQQYTTWFDQYTVYPFLYYFSPEDIEYIHRLAISPTLNCNISEKYRLLEDLMNKRGFKLIGGGTNRRAYECIYDNRVVAKVATDWDGFSSNLKEFVNQNVLKPFCNKIFYVSPCGTLSIIEKVVPIKTVPEFQKYCGEIFDILFRKIRNNDLGMDDIGCRSMMNWGYRPGFGPVLLDYPSMYVEDPNKRLCKNIVNGHMCFGTLDYDDGFNRIVCTECGKAYHAVTLVKPKGSEIDSLLQAVGYRKNKKEGVSRMRFKLINAETGEVIKSVDCGGNSDYVDSSIAKKPSMKFVKEDNNNEENNVSSEQTTTEIDSTGENESVLDRFIKKFNQLNSEIKNLDDQSPVELLKSIEKNSKSQNNMITEKEAYELYQNVSVATTMSIDLDKTKIINAETVKEEDSLINYLLKKISDNDDPFVTFYKLLNTVKGTKLFCKTLVNYWNAFVSIANLNKGASKNIYRIYSKIYDEYINTVAIALDDYKLNIALSGKFEYNTQNVVNIIESSIDNISKLIKDTPDEYKKELLIINVNYDNVKFLNLRNKDK